METQETYISQTILNKKDKAREYTLLDLMTTFSRYSYQDSMAKNCQTD